MGWASNYIQSLLQENPVLFRPRGNSMQPQIKSGQLCTVVPVRGPIAAYVGKGDVVLCKVNGREYLHKVHSIKWHATKTDILNNVYLEKNEYQIGNNKGHINGWIKGTHIYGKLVKVEP